MRRLVRGTDRRRASARQRIPGTPGAVHPNQHRRATWLLARLLVPARQAVPRRRAAEAGEFAGGACLTDQDPSGRRMLSAARGG